MFLKVTCLLPFFLIFSVAEKYHTTDTLLTRIKLKCATVPQLSCRVENGILVVDWNKHVSNKSNALLVFNEHARENYRGVGVERHS